MTPSELTKELTSKTTLGVAGIVVLVFGLYFAISSMQQQTNTKSSAHEPSASGDASKTYSPSVNCTSSGQLCSPAYSIPLKANTPIRVKFTANPYHCSSIRVHLLVDGVEKHVSEWLGWPKAPAPFNTLPLATGEIDLGSVGSGNHTLGVQAEGQVSGCNKGVLGAWSGTVVFTTGTSTGNKLALNLLLHGIGKAGDSVKPGAAGGGNTSPKRPERDVRVDLYNSQDQKVKSVTGKVTFDSASGSFKGEVDMGTGITTGSYLVKVKFPQSLEEQIGEIQSITAGVTKTLPQESFVTGDVNNDGAVSLNVLDFNILIGCIKGSSCTPEQKLQADLDDSGKVDQFDFNLFIREITHITAK